MADWGITATLAPAGTNVNWFRMMGGTSPNTDNMVLQTVLVYMSSTVTANVRVGVYQGGALDNPTGASLVEDLGLVANGGAAGWKTATSSGNPSLTKAAVTWIAIKGNDGTINVNNSGSSGDAGDFQSVRGRNDQSGAITGGASEDNAFPATIDGTSAFSSFWYACYLTYSISGGVSIPVLAHHYRMLQGVG